ncbi:hypothetical protein DAEQUDRAFT_766823 [Daedalea quercina L-15889]|uniref:Uncharacterized protein n=1 Tax=Daedalea quercina L-15889 TaxID=1314783 RepID=A0A165P7H8_9APHY|nr:hypothetical protein DAEQUDRAFT_766823 [Daedalea quercina L-15889]
MTEALTALPRRLTGAFGQNSSKLKQFAFDRWFGQVAKVKRAVKSGRAPDLTGTETPYKFGYCTLVVARAQRDADAFPDADHIATIKYLISSGAPKDSSDIAGLTALHHATMSTQGPTLALVRILLESGANPVNAATSVTVRSTYRDMGSLMSVSAFTRQTIGLSTAPQPNTHSRSVHVPLKRELVCTVEAAGNETAYMRIATTVFTKGVGRAKAYFPAFKSKDELVCKVGEVLAEQPF